MAFLSACATAPFGSFEAEPGERVGLVNLVEDQFTHIHVGTTVFNNNESVHDAVDLDVPAYINQTARETLERNGFQVIDLAANRLPSHEGSSLLHAGWNGLDIRNVHREPLQDLMRELDLDWILVFESTNLTDPIGGTTVSYAGYGLYTRSFMTLSGAHAYSHVRGYGITSDPALLVAWKGPEKSPSVDFQAIDESTIESLEQEIRRLSDLIVSNTLAEMGIR